MSGRVAETIGNIRGNVEFAREGLAKRWEESTLYQRLHPNLPPTLSAQELLQKIDFSESSKLIGKLGHVFVINGKKNDTPILAQQYWPQHGMPDEVVRQLVDGEGRLRFHLKPSEHRRLVGHSPLKAAMMTIDALAPLYDNNQYPLRGSITEVENGRKRGVDGFNAHQRPHIKTVTQGAAELLDQARKIGFRKITRNTRVAALRGATWHDHVNLWSRRLHANGAPLMMSQIAPLSQKDPLVDRVNAVMVFHNEKEMSSLLEANNATSSTKAVEFLSHVDPAIPAILIADKLHIGQDRLPSEWTDPKGILRDVRVGFNAFFTTDAAGYTQDGKRFVVNISYNPRVENEIFSRFTGRNTVVVDSKRHTNGVTNMPEAIHAYLEYPDISQRVSHSEVMEAIMWDPAGHGDSLRLAIISAFAYNPWLQQVEFNIDDPDAPIGLGEHPDKNLPALLSPERIKEVQHRQYTFTRDTIDEQLDAIKQKFKDKGVDIHALVEAGKQLRPPVTETLRRELVAA